MSGERQPDATEQNSTLARVLGEFGGGLVATGVVAVGVGMVADNYVDPLLIWGGNDCSVVEGVYACAGYPPTGIMFLAVLSVVAVVGTMEVASRWSR